MFGDWFLDHLQEICQEVAEIRKAVEVERGESEHLLFYAAELIRLRQAYGPAITPQVVDHDTIPDEDLIETGRRCRQQLKEYPDMPQHLRELKQLRLELDVYSSLILRQLPKEKSEAGQHPARKPPQILIVGDVMLDVDVHLETVRYAGPEGFPVVREVSRDERAGGAGAVALMARALGADVTLCTRCRNSDRLTEQGVSVHNGHWAEPIKVRHFLDGRQLFRTDAEDTTPASDTDILHVLQDAEAFEPEVVLVSDYGKGLVTRCMMHQLLARFPRIPIIVDPARGADWNLYRGAAAVVPNEDEWSTALDAGLGPLDASVGNMLRIQKRGPGGISVHRPDGGHARIPGHNINCIDVCGAGDQVLATLGVMLAEGHDWITAARIANLAAALKCERRGATPVPRQELDDAVLRHGLIAAASPQVAAV